MSGMTASGNAFDRMKPDEKGTTHHHDEQVDIYPEAASEEMESYVTVKTWAVVVVRKLSFLSQPLCPPG